MPISKVFSKGNFNIYFVTLGKELFNILWNVSIKIDLLFEIGRSAIRTHIGDITASIEAHVGPAAAAAAAMAIATNVREEEGDEELQVAKHGPHTAAAKRVWKFGVGE